MTFRLINWILAIGHCLAKSMIDTNTDDYLFICIENVFRIRDCAILNCYGWK